MSNPGSIPPSAKAMAYIDEEGVVIEFHAIEAGQFVDVKYAGNRVFHSPDQDIPGKAHLINETNSHCRWVNFLGHWF